MSKPGRFSVKWISRYMKGNVGHGVVFDSQQNDPLVVGYADSNYVGKLDDRDLQLEYMALAEAAKKALLLKGLPKKLSVEQDGVQLYCDSQMAIYLIKNQVYHARSKRIDMRYHEIRELIASREIILQKVHTSENASDMLTKPFIVNKFNHCLDLLKYLQLLEEHGDPTHFWCVRNSVVVCLLRDLIFVKVEIC
ncbi:UNVERIFIED_CONTAM: Retrovirus-related Pol polyprotein from transposon TNT 1-94 [Sesamum radiatum]|uniref:Retrovirus-related Pol polyprotein from transposon TNT 1-94 n=1 Tax=Sesamum radiatum TaxID=300843 RepID=A0AAW2VKH0_SESRA